MTLPRRLEVEDVLRSQDRFIEQAMQMEASRQFALREYKRHRRKRRIEATLWALAIAVMVGLALLWRPR